MSTRIKSKLKRKARNVGVFYSRLSPVELDRIAAPFDQEFVPSKPLTPAMRRQEERAKRKRGRPVIGEGSEKVLVTLEKGLLRDADNYARRVGRNRSNLIAEGLRSIIYAEPNPPRPRQSPRAA
jgi:hypothetical protein